jgi:hypothetical protein
MLFLNDLIVKLEEYEKMSGSGISEYLMIVSMLMGYACMEGRIGCIKLYVC